MHTVLERLARTESESAPAATFEAPTQLFRYDPPVSRATIANWQRDIDRIYQPVDRLSRLVIRWEAGDVWQPIQRFLIWQCENPNTVAVPPIMMTGVTGPSPRATGHYCGPGYCLCAMKKNAWRGSNNKLTDRATWELYRDTGLVGRRWWTIQGSRGGHRFLWDLDELESKLCAMAGGPNQTPDPGDLPYAPFDERVLDKIGPLDKVKKWKGALDFAARNLAQLTAEERADAIKAREALWEWIDWGIDEAWDIGGKYFKETLRGMGRSTPGKEKSDLDYEQVEKYFTNESVDV